MGKKLNITTNKAQLQGKIRFIGRGCSYDTKSNEKSEEKNLESRRHYGSCSRS